MMLFCQMKLNKDFICFALPSALTVVTRFCSHGCIACVHVIQTVDAYDFGPSIQIELHKNTLTNTHAHPIRP